MKTGVRAHDYGKRTIPEMAELLKGKGYDCAQLALPKAFSEIESYEDISLKTIDRIRDTFADAGISISVFGCYMDLANPDADIRKNAVETFTKCLELNKELGAEVVGTETAYPHLSDKEKEIWRPFMFDSILRITEAANRMNVKAAIEPVSWHPLTDLPTVLEALRKANDPEHLRLIFDPANVLRDPDHTDQKACWKTWLSNIGPYIDAMHIKDFRLDEDGNYIPLPLGEGVIDYTEIAGWLHQNRPDMPLLREEMNPSLDLPDIEYLRNF